MTLRSFWKDTSGATRTTVPALVRRMEAGAVPSSRELLAGCAEIVAAHRTPRFSEDQLTSRLRADTLDLAVHFLRLARSVRERDDVVALWLAPSGDSSTRDASYLLSQGAKLSDVVQELHAKGAGELKDVRSRLLEPLVSQTEGESARVLVVGSPTPDGSLTAVRREVSDAWRVMLCVDFELLSPGLHEACEGSPLVVSVPSWLEASPRVAQDDVLAEHLFVDGPADSDRASAMLRLWQAPKPGESTHSAADMWDVAGRI